ncbi:cyclodeaminase/cyclohydrolase family protein [Haloimpatiens sp. FM7315]|uniref:cyclodeaminase/cyclohydrolase family protein n=1 Tax=Haloimpatiens sp. FM7315 TaxID=3298609 RepID=UPI0035A3796A
MEMESYINELASNSPAPGGGSVSALAGSLANALGTMVFNLTIGKKIFHTYEKNLQDIITDSLQVVQAQRKEFLVLMDKDTEAFMKVMEAFKLPKSTEEEKEVRNQKIQESYVSALEVPYEVAKKALKTYEYILIACKYGNKNAISDVGVATLMTASSVEGAILNVKINLSGLKDEVYKNEMYMKCDEMLRESETKKAEIMKIVNSKIQP